jgi:hypothetical protein
MALPNEVRTEVESVMQEYCAKKIPLQHRDKIRLSFGIRGSSVTLYEERPAWDRRGEWSKLSIAQFRYGEDGKWELYCADRNERWNLYFDIDASEDIHDLLDEVDDNPTGIFWG